MKQDSFSNSKDKKTGDIIWSKDIDSFCVSRQKIVQEEDGKQMRRWKEKKEGDREED